MARTVMSQTHCPLIVAPWAPAEPGAASGAGRSGPDLKPEHPATHQYHQPPLNIVAAFAGIDVVAQNA